MPQSDRGGEEKTLGPAWATRRLPDQTAAYSVPDGVADRIVETRYAPTDDADHWAYKSSGFDLVEPIRLG